MLLGVSVSVQAVLAIGPAMIGGIAFVVVVAIGASFDICRLLGLPLRMSILVDRGNSICGNSAIAAVAPVIDADGDDVASSIAFTAVLGVVVVLGLPFLVPVVLWFIVGFVVVALLRTFDLIPHPWLRPIASTATQLTIVSMAALGLGVDVRSVARAGLRVTAAVTLSLLVLGAISLGLIYVVGVS